MKLENQSMDNVVTRSKRTTYDMIELILAWRLQIVLSDLHLNFLKQKVPVEDGIYAVLSSAALVELAKSIPVHSLILSPATSSVYLFFFFLALCPAELSLLSQ